MARVLPAMSTRSRRLVCIALIASGLYAVLSLVGAVVFVEMSLRLPKRSVTAQEATIAHQHAADLGARIEEVQVRSQEGLRLKGWYVTPERPNGSVVMLFHGVTDNRLGVGGFAELFLRHGYSILMADSRTHGDSDGEIATYGVREAQDVHRWVAWLYEDRRPGCVYGFGESMGAAILLQSLAAEGRFCAVIAESAFADFRDAVYDRMSGAFHAGPWLARTILRPTVEAGFIYARMRYAVDFAAQSPRSAVAHSRVPVLLIHGEQDSVIRLRNSQEIKAGNPSTNFWLVPGAEHCGAWSAQPRLFEQRVLAWFATHRG